MSRARLPLCTKCGETRCYEGRTICGYCRSPQTEASKAAAKRWKLKVGPPRLRQVSNESRKRLRDEFLSEYGSRCTCCGENEPVFLTLEHVKRDGAAHRKSLSSKGASSALADLRRKGWPKDGYTILCFNCNVGRWRLGLCPHQTK